jgi:hypothetical protein
MSDIANLISALATAVQADLNLINAAAIEIETLINVGTMTTANQIKIVAQLNSILAATNDILIGSNQLPGIFPLNIGAGPTGPTA